MGKHSMTPTHSITRASYQKHNEVPSVRTLWALWSRCSVDTHKKMCRKVFVLFYRWFGFYFLKIIILFVEAGGFQGFLKILEKL